MYYEILGVTSTSTDKEIKKKFKEITAILHPDVNKNKTDEEREIINNQFMEVQEAYEILKDPDKRKQYDSNLKIQTDDEFEPKSGIDLDIMNKEDKSKKGESIVVILDVTIREIYNKSTKLCEYKKVIPCEKCSGFNIDDIKMLNTMGDYRCPHCNGKGKLETNNYIGHGVVSFTDECIPCKGYGFISHPDIMCDHCENGTIVVEDNLEIKLDNTIKHGKKIIIENSGSYVTTYENPGDIIIIINEINDDTYKRSINGRDLYIIYNILFEDAMCLKTTNIAVENINGKYINVDIPPGIHITPYYTIRIKNEGLDGDLYILFNIIYPINKQSDSLWLVQSTDNIEFNITNINIYNANTLFIINNPIKLENIAIEKEKENESCIVM